MSAGRQGSNSSRSSCISKGSAAGVAAAGVDPGAEATRAGRAARGRAPPASRSATRRMPSVRISRSTGSPSSPAISESRPRGDPAVEVHLPEPVLGVAEALRRTRGRRRCAASMWGTPQRSRRDLAPAPSSPASSSVPSACGSGRRASRCQAAAAPRRRARCRRPRQASAALRASPGRARAQLLAAGQQRRAAPSSLRQPALGLELPRWASITSAAAGRSSAGTSSQTSASSASRERSPRSSAASRRRSRISGARRTRPASPPGR